MTPGGQKSDKHAFPIRFDQQRWGKFNKYFNLHLKKTFGLVFLHFSTLLSPFLQCSCECLFVEGL